MIIIIIYCNLDFFPEVAKHKIKEAQILNKKNVIKITSSKFN